MILFYEKYSYIDFNLFIIIYVVIFLIHGHNMLLLYSFGY